jgi:putative transposase
MSRGRLARAAHHGGKNIARPAGEVRLRELLSDQVLDLRLERSRDGAGGLRLTGEGSMLGELAKAVLERALEAELSESWQSL